MSSIFAVRMLQVTKSFGKFRALDSLDLAVRRGSCAALLGPNGAGKTTTMRIITGQLTVDEGTVEVFGKTPSQRNISVNSKIGFVPQNDNLEMELTVRDNLDIYSRLFGIGRRRRDVNVARALETTGLKEYAGRRVEELSGGYRRRTLIARALVSDPELLILDEPTVGLDAEVRFSILDTLEALKASGLTIVVTSHYIDELSSLIDDVAIISGGIVKGSYSVAELSESFANYRSVSSTNRGALFDQVGEGYLVNLTDGKDGGRCIVHSDFVPESVPSHTLTFSEMYLAALRLP